MHIITLTVLVAVGFLLLAGSARADVAPVPSTTAQFTSSDEYKAARAELKNLTRYVAEQRKTVRKCKGTGAKRSCRDRVVQLPLSDDDYSDVSESFADAIKDLDIMLESRIQDRERAAEEWLADRSQDRKDAITAVYERAVEDAGIVYENRVLELERQQVEFEAWVEGTYEMWVVSNQPPAPELTAGNYTLCIKMIYGGDASKARPKPAKPAKPKLSGKWPRNEPTKKNRKGNVTSAWRKWDADRQKMKKYDTAIENYEKVLDDWKEENGAFADCMDTENDEDADAWRDEQLHDIAQAVDFEIRKAEKIRDAVIDNASRTQDRALDRAERLDSRDARDTERAFRTMEATEEKLVRRIEREGNKLLAKLSA
jgi:hypothetical protein